MAFKNVQIEVIFSPVGGVILFLLVIGKGPLCVGSFGLLISFVGCVSYGWSQWRLMEQNLNNMLSK